jgi:hypothetical protein
VLERLTLTTGFPFSEKIAVLAIGYPGDGCEALRSFAALHDVRRFDLVCISLIHTISDAMSSNARPLQLEERPSVFISTFTVPAEAITREARGRDVAYSDISAECESKTTVGFAV